MKKVFASVLLTITALCGLLGFAACGEKEAVFDIYYNGGGYELGIKEYGGKDVEIPAYSEGRKISVIKKEAFYGYTTLESVTIPNTIILIKKGAFKGCTLLQKITYEGTYAEWENIMKEDGWIMSSTMSQVLLYCTDGVYSLFTP